VNGTFSLTIKGWLVVGLVVGFLVLFGIYSGEILIPITIFCMAGIVAFDSMQIHLRRYKSGIAYSPTALFVICALFGPIAIIWYFLVRVRIARGTMPLKDEFKRRQKTV
jgi:hypothetical protein